MSRRAFSLIEVAIVLVIVGIGAAIAAPRYAAALSRYRAEAAARRVAADLTLARTVARERSTDCTVTFDLDTNEIRLDVAGTSDTVRSIDGGGPYETDLTGSPYHATIVSALAASSGRASVAFNGYGVADRDGTITVEAGGVQRSVNLDDKNRSVEVEAP